MSSEHLSDIRKRIAATRQLETVFTAMRGLAAARSHDAQKSLDGVRSYASAVGEAIQIALSLAPSEPTAPPSASKRIVLAFCSEQGFVGGFDDRVLRAAALSSPQASLYVVGQKGKTSATERGLTVAWSTPMAAHAVDAPAVAERIADALYDQVSSGERIQVELVHMAPASPSEIGVISKPIVPLDLARFPRVSDRAPPLVNLAPPLLLSTLTEEYVFAELCEAALLSVASENLARMQAMTAARSNVRKTLDELTARHRRLRQEQITEELLELSRPGGALTPTR